MQQQHDIEYTIKLILSFKQNYKKNFGVKFHIII
jgi:hypothetical protein